MAEERANNEMLATDMNRQVEEIWRQLGVFIDEHYLAFMTHRANGCGPSPRTEATEAQRTLNEIRVWMKEVQQREVQTLKLIWIRTREVDEDKQTNAAGSARRRSSTDDEADETADATNGRARTLRHPVSAWKEYAQPQRNAQSNGGAAAAAAAAGDARADSNSDSDSSSTVRPSKRTKLGDKRPAGGAAGAVAGMGVSFFSSSSRVGCASPPVRPTRAHPSWSACPLLDPRAVFPPPHHSRSHAGRHAHNLPTALVKKLARRGGKIPYDWDARWFFAAKIQ
jgi:hypothetical protein